MQYALAATLAFEAEAAALPAWDVPLHRDGGEWDELPYSECGSPQAAVGWLERNRLADHAHLVAGDPRYAWIARQRAGE